MNYTKNFIKKKNINSTKTSNIIFEIQKAPFNHE